MTKVLYSATMSLDGYIAGPGGDMSWLRPYLQPNPPIEQLQREIGALLVGGRTHRGDDPHRGTDQEGAFGGTWDGPVFVVTRQPSTDEGSLHFVGEPQAALEEAKVPLRADMSTCSEPSWPVSAWTSVRSTRS